MSKQESLGGFEPDAARYRKASEPHESSEAASKAIKAFYDEVSELRVKYKMRDLFLIWTVCEIDENGDEVVSVGSSGFGNQSMWLSMVATAYGALREKHETLMKRLISGKG